MAAGILPLTINGNVLLMHENRKGDYFYIDVGGKRENHDKDEWATAIREWREETPLPLPSKIKEKLYFKSFNYISFLVEYDEIHLPEGFIWFPLTQLNTTNLSLHPRIREILCKYLTCPRSLIENSNAVSFR